MTTTTLTADQSGDPDAAGYLLAYAAAAGPRERDFLIQIDSELEYVEWRGDQHARPWQVVRGYLGTAPATHTSGATVTLEPALAVGGGVTVTGSGGSSVAGASTIALAATVTASGDIAEVASEIVALPSAFASGSSITFLSDDVNLQGGTGIDDGSDEPGGSATMTGGQSTTAAAGAAFSIKGGGSVDDVSAGGDARIQGGNAASGHGQRGGDVYIAAGLGDGAGRAGLVHLNALPTADPHVVGALWNSTGTLKVSAG